MSAANHTAIIAPELSTSRPVTAGDSLQNFKDPHVALPPLNTTPPNAAVVRSVPPPVQPQPSKLPSSINPRTSVVMNRSASAMSDSPVMNETLTSIDEHISDMSTPRHSMIDRRELADSGSEYSGVGRGPSAARLSYITGIETDEEDGHYTEAEVRKWSPRHVAEYLEEVGVSIAHCQAFEAQEITGDVLLGLDLDQLSMPEFRLGSTLGPRLQTWQKVQALQTEILGINAEQNRMSRMSMIGQTSDALARTRSSATVKSTPRWSTAQHPNLNSSLLRSTIHEGPTRAPHTAPLAGVNYVGTSDELSSTSQSTLSEGLPNRPLASMDRLQVFPLASRPLSADMSTYSNGSRSTHRKKPSLDQEWTMSGIPNAVRPPSSYKTMQEGASSHKLSLSLGRGGNQIGSAYSGYTPQDLDRGYASEAETQKSRNVLRKRDAAGSRQGGAVDDSRRKSLHSAKSSRAENGGPRLNGGHARKSSGNRRSFLGRSTSEDTLDIAASPHYGNIAPSKDSPFARSETDGSDSVTMENKSPTMSMNSTATKGSSMLSRFGPFRAISEAVTGSEKSAAKSPNPQNPTSPPVGSPRTGNSSVPSGASSFENGRRGKSRFASAGSTLPGQPRRKGKKQTSAYLRGLEKKTPAEQMQDCDFSGWMKKKRSVMSPTWNTRLFILKGRRLSYYYSENDTEEKGLIDITAHRVLPATDDPIIGLHAAFSNTTSNPSTPPHSRLETTAARDAIEVARASPRLPPNSTPFVFKIAPPRAGPHTKQNLHFTKPTTHFFAVDDRHQGRLWMAALIKANIELDMSKELKTTYTASLISLPKAIAMKRRPPNLMGPDHTIDEVASTMEGPGLGIDGVPVNGQPVDDEARTPRTLPADAGHATNSKQTLEIPPIDPMEANEEPLLEPNMIRNSATSVASHVFEPGQSHTARAEAEPVQ